MKYLLPVFGIISMFAWCIFLLDQQRIEIKRLKYELRMLEAEHKSCTSDTKECDNEIAYLNNAIVGLMEATQ